MIHNRTICSFVIIFVQKSKILTLYWRQVGVRTRQFIWQLCAMSDIYLRIFLSEGFRTATASPLSTL